MLTKKSTLVVAVCALFSSGCAIKAYDGPKLTDDKVATVTLKVPTAAYVPFFWIFPVNMLTWFGEDWRETSWTNDITIDTDSLDLVDRETWITEDLLPRYWSGKATTGKVEMNRFKTVKLRPGLYQFNSETSSLFGKLTPEILVSKSKSTCEDNTCCEDTKDKDCEGDDYLVEYNECQLKFLVEAGHRYEVFIKNQKLMLRNLGDQLTTKAKCKSYEHYR